MAYKDILVFLDNGESNTPRVDTAIALASAHNAHLVGVAYNIDVPGHIARLVPGFSAEKQREASRIVAESLTADFIKRAEAAGISAASTVIKCRESKAPLKLAAYARNFDLSILRHVNQGNDQSDLDSAVSEEVLFASGRPVLYIPDVGVKPPSRALIAWDGSRAASRAIHDALPLLSKMEKVVVLTVDSDPSKAEKKTRRGQAMLEHLIRHGINAELKFASSEGSDIALTILKSLTDTGSDLLVTGGYGTSRLREFVLGGVTRTLFKNMTTAVCMSN